MGTRDPVFSSWLGSEAEPGRLCSGRRTVRTAGGGSQTGTVTPPPAAPPLPRARPTGAYVAGRWGSCWPGNAACPRRCCTGRGGGRAGSGCPGRPRDTPHTRHCYRSPRPPPPGRGGGRWANEGRYRLSTQGSLPVGLGRAREQHLTFTDIGLCSLPSAVTDPGSLILGTVLSSSSYEAQVWPAPAI